MDATQLYIQKNITLLFFQLLFQQKVHGQILAKPNIFLLPGVRERPDFAWFTDEQLIILIEKGAIEVPKFVIEVISNNDAAQKITAKMQIYRTAGVEVVWHVYPNQKEIHVYSGKNLSQSLVCIGEDVCSAAPVLENFAFPATDFFKN